MVVGPCDVRERRALCKSCYSKTTWFPVAHRHVSKQNGTRSPHYAYQNARSFNLRDMELLSPSGRKIVPQVEKTLK